MKFLFLLMNVFLQKPFKSHYPLSIIVIQTQNEKERQNEVSRKVITDYFSNRYLVIFIYFFSKLKWMTKISFCTSNSLKKF